MLDLGLVIDTIDTLNDLISGSNPDDAEKLLSPEEKETHKKILKAIKRGYFKNNKKILEALQDLKKIDLEKLKTEDELQQYTVKRLNELLALLTGRGYNLEKVFEFYNSWVDVQTALHLLALQDDFDALRALLAKRQKEAEEEKVYRQNLAKILESIRSRFSGLIKEVESHWEKYYEALGRLKEIELQKELIEMDIEEELNKKIALQNLARKRLAVIEKKIGINQNKLGEAQGRLLQAIEKFSQAHEAKIETSRKIQHRERRLDELRGERVANATQTTALGVQLHAAVRDGNVVEAEGLGREIEVKKVRHAEIIVEEDSVQRELRELRDVERAQQSVAQECFETKAEAAQQVKEAEEKVQESLVERDKVTSNAVKSLRSSDERTRKLEEKRDGLAGEADALRPVVEDLHKKAVNAHAETKNLLAEGQAAARELGEPGGENEVARFRQVDIDNKRKELDIAERRREELSKKVRDLKVELRDLQSEIAQLSSDGDPEDELELKQEKLEDFKKTLESRERTLAEADQEKRRLEGELQTLRSAGVSTNAACDPRLVAGLAGATRAFESDRATAASLPGSTRENAPPVVAPAVSNSTPGNIPTLPTGAPPPYTELEQQQEEEQPPPAYSPPRHR